MDEHFSFFLKKFVPEIYRYEVPETSIARYKNKLPDQLLSYWTEHGWAGYADGLFWTVNPQDYESIISHWIPTTGLNQTEKYHVIARGAFGVLYVWGEKGGHCLNISSYAGRYYSFSNPFTGEKLELGAHVFFSSLNPAYNDLSDLFKPALEKLGPLKSDEMYGFVPALALGGPMELENLQKVKTIEHLTFLSQLSPLQDWGFPDV
ncbi:glutamyl-tRNA amidotransferase [Pseudomonas syringae]|uniref:Glutamyl-tRNA amidotransferase n=1 Tax=Pseudomonas syringae TaxID=317 RepID=A0A244ELD1_PSESX|nr:GAD-like domain-containing protein [Pseudomonas syringae]OUM05286.1 glutamyl-tRNA amidotransferase [Pseudomonas syringae]